MSDPIELLRTQVDLGGLMRVLGNNLYSTPHVAIRELVQNAHDSCVRRQIEDGDTFEPAIVVTPDPHARTLTITDTGAGLTRDEIVKYLATVGAGYTGKLRAEGKGDDALIGAFGLGFLSAFVVSDRVDLFTTSYQEPDQGWHFQSRGGERYQLGPSAPGPVGTRVVLHLGESFATLANPEIVTKLLERYCCLLTFPVHPGKLDKDPVNRPSPPWRRSGDSPLRKRRMNLDFAKRFELRFEPICTFEIEPTEKSRARGLVWIQDGATYGTSDNRNMSVFVRGMLISPDERELLPPGEASRGESSRPTTSPPPPAARTCSATRATTPWPRRSTRPSSTASPRWPSASPPPGAGSSSATTRPCSAPRSATCASSISSPPISRSRRAKAR